MSDKYAQRNNQGHHRIADDEPLALRMLKEEHHIFRELFDRAEDADDEERAEIGAEICMRLAVHMAIEEEILYPALILATGRDEVNEGIVEHASGKRLAAEIEQLDGDEELYGAKIHVLGEETIHHIDEEDEELFVEAREAHDKGCIDLDELGRRLRDRQADLYDEISAEGEMGETDEALAEEIDKI